MHGATVLFEYAITKDDEPGVFVSAQFLRNGEMYQGMKRLKVPPEDHKLEVQISTDKPQYEPGQSAVYKIQIKSADGKPVAQADMSLGVVDEAIYAIRPEDAPDILKFFYGNEYNSVSTQDSLTYYFSGEAGNRRMFLALGKTAETALAQLKPPALVEPKVRKLFPDTAFWAADLTTDASGTAEAHLTFPDSLPPGVRRRAVSQRLSSSAQAC